jgi:hypothetical protein
MPLMEKVFLGIVTVPERADYLEQVKAGVADHLSAVGEVTVVTDTEHRGPAWAKNQLLRMALATDATHFFLSEDDVVVQSYEAITGYLRASRESGWEHLSFHAHGPANREPVGTDDTGTVTYWPHYVGAWAMFTRRSIESCGLFDEEFKGSWEHPVHTLELSFAGFHPLPPEPYELRAADATGSENWLKEIPGSIERTTLPHTEQWTADRLRGRQHWKDTYPDSYRLVFSR